jgi:hypothetical protein
MEGGYSFHFDYYPRFKDKKLTRIGHARTIRRIGPTHTPRIGIDRDIVVGAGQGGQLAPPRVQFDTGPDPGPEVRVAVAVGDVRRLVLYAHQAFIRFAPVLAGHRPNAELGGIIVHVSQASSRAYGKHGRTELAARGLVGHDCPIMIPKIILFPPIFVGPAAVHRQQASAQGQQFKITP